MTDPWLPLLDPPREDVERLVGTVRGNLDGVGAGLSVWCGPSIGWRDFGDVVLGGGQATVVRAMRDGGVRLLVGLTFDLGEAPPLRRHGADEEPAAA